MSGVDDLVAFLRRCLDDDFEVAQVADALSRSPWKSEVTVDGTGYTEGRIVCGDGFTLVHVEDQTPERAEAEHIARWDPARVLAEVKAKRAILDAHGPCCNDAWCTNKGCATCDRYNTGFKIYPCATLRLLAQPYAGHEGWREEWRVAD